MFIRRVGDCESVPWWLGRAWYDTLRAQVVCAPIPLNLVLAFGRAVWLWARFRHVTVGMSAREAYLAGCIASRREIGRVGRISQASAPGWKNHSGDDNEGVDKDVLDQLLKQANPWW